MLSSDDGIKVRRLEVIIEEGRVVRREVKMG